MGGVKFACEPLEFGGEVSMGRSVFSRCEMALVRNEVMEDEA